MYFYILLAFDAVRGLYQFFGNIHSCLLMILGMWGIDMKYGYAVDGIYDAYNAHRA
jgi:hypothetical protein